MTRTHDDHVGSAELRCPNCIGEPRYLRRAAWHVAAFTDRLVAPFERRRRAVSTEASPIFVVGCSHSGTTILTAVLNNHPRIVSLTAETKIMCRYRTLRTHRAWLRRGFETAERDGKSRFCEKTPNHVFFIDRIFRCYPNARVVVIERDGRDVALSLAERWNGGFDRALRKWVAAIRAARRYLDDPRVTTVRYERFVSETETVMSEIWEFLGEPVVENVLEDREYWSINYDGPPPADAVSPSSAHQEYRVWQVNQPIFDGSGRWRSELTGEQSRLVAEVAGDVLEEIGYPA